jgi:hypothetical protein
LRRQLRARCRFCDHETRRAEIAGQSDSEVACTHCHKCRSPTHQRAPDRFRTGTPCGWQRSQQWYRQSQQADPRTGAGLSQNGNAQREGVTRVRSVDLSSKEGLSASAGCVGVLDSYADGRVVAAASRLGCMRRSWPGRAPLSDGILGVSKPVTVSRPTCDHAMRSTATHPTSEYRKH